MPFGLANALATFQAYINHTLTGLVDSICVVYLDDIVIYTCRTRADHMQDVCSVLGRLCRYELFANIEKCEFAVDTVEFLGFIVSTTGVNTDPERVWTITDWPMPSCVKDIQRFLGFTNFYCCFVKGYSHIVSPLTKLTKFVCSINVLSESMTM